jgi:hypothetical protein
MIKLNSETIGSKELDTEGNFSSKDTSTISNSTQGQLSDYTGESISNPRSEKYSQARASSTSFPGSSNFGVQGPFNELYKDTGSGNFNVSYSLGDSAFAPTSSAPPKPVAKKPAISEKISTDSGPSGSGGFKNITLGAGLKPLKFDKVDLSGGKPNETQALTPREMRRNQRNVKFLKRRIRKGERKGDDMASTRQALGNAQAQQAGNFKPGQKFKTPTSTGSYVTPKQNREKNGSVIGNTLKNTFGKKEGGSKVGNALRNAGGIFKKKTKTGSGFGGY